jgi:hypothetical protein
MDISKMTLIGSFAVDSGQAMVGDPCYLDQWEVWDDKVDSFDEYANKAGSYGYLGSAQATLTKGYGELGISNAVVFSTGYGDGIYPVYAEINDEGRVTRVVIDFVGEDEE